ncbi:hypothetical protein [uncultured Secundilactobacillus sp.]|uniref:hypothetical protein n=1 Tax=uncultured Secundilactobacillus sp. TaxID=2813935 RepID=UPI002582A5E8|nr:hypothetical protein [uncultured Secundilactobacillus sp.]
MHLTLEQIQYREAMWSDIATDILKKDHLSLDDARQLFQLLKMLDNLKSKKMELMA